MSPYHHILILVYTIYYTNGYSINAGSSELCPQAYRKIFHGCVPKGNITAGTFSRVTAATTMKACAYECCVKEECNVALLSDDACYHIICASNDLCLPIASPDNGNSVSMVLIRPTVLNGEASWEDLIQEQDISTDSIGRDVYNALASAASRQHNPDTKTFEEAYKDLLEIEDSSSASTYSYNTACELNTQSDNNVCRENQHCEPNNAKSRAGTCRCNRGYYQLRDGNCDLVARPLNGNLTAAGENGRENGNYDRENGDFVRKNDDFVKQNDDFVKENDVDLVTLAGVTTSTKHPLVVSTDNKIVRLPISEVTLQASADPSAAETGEKYQYEWTLLTQPVQNGAVKHQTADQLELTKLSEGLYTFKVAISSDTSYGESFVNVTVLPLSRINRPPQIVITPANQTIKLPNNGAVLDASSSTDDDGIVAYHWELQQGPLGYQPDLKDTPTLQLNDLNKAGNYTFKLTVTDTDKATNTSIANITVLKITDYPPEANAGQDTIIYLPHNQITLNGNMSIDDHQITTWEWTKSPDDVDKAVDMQDTHTAYLRLSDMEEGMYSFVLKVMDSANQSSTAQVHVFVKPATNQPPLASAGHNTTISLPQTWTLLDGGNSTDDNRIVAYRWKQLSGASQAKLVTSNATRTNVTGLTKGEYVFQLAVTDDSGNTAEDKVHVTVNQNKNQPPKANAGPDFSTHLPLPALYLNASLSSDDWSVVRFHWTTCSGSLALGTLAPPTETQAVLVVVGVTAPGRYCYNVTVYDAQGLSDSDSVWVAVGRDEQRGSLVEMVVKVNVGGDENDEGLTESAYDVLVAKLALLVEGAAGQELQVRSLTNERGTGNAIVSFYVKDVASGKPLPANQVVHHLRNKLRMDASLLGYSVARVQTTICQNTCSGHGVCDELTRRCICEVFWMQNMWNLYWLSSDDAAFEADCSWSVLYVVLGGVSVVIGTSGAIWFLVYLCFSWCTRRHQSKTSNSTYKLIENTEETPPCFGNRNGKVDLSYSDTDSDVVFETSRPPKLPARFTSDARSNNNSNNSHKSSRNGFSKSSRRLKT